MSMTSEAMGFILQAGSGPPVSNVMISFCPSAPEGAEVPITDILGNMAWLVITLFSLAILLSVGALLIGRSIGNRGLVLTGVIGLGICIGAAIVYFVAPEVISGILGDGCV